MGDEPTIPYQDPDITEDARLLRTSSLTLDAAVYKYVTFNERDPGQWHIGITSDTIAMFDVDQIVPVEDIVAFARLLNNTIYNRFGVQNRVLVIRTTNGYHIVSDADLEHVQWMALYEAIYHNINKGHLLLPLDELHVMLSLKYEKTTLRISPKHGDREIYEPIRMITS